MPYFSRYATSQFLYILIVNVHSFLVDNKYYDFHTQLDEREIYDTQPESSVFQDTACIRSVNRLSFFFLQNVIASSI